MNKRDFLKSGLGLAGMGLIKPTETIAKLENLPAFELPKLPYAFDFLEPAIDARTMELHYTKHHGAYVEKLNAEVAAGTFKYKNLEELLVNYAAGNKTIRNHGGGHYNHSLLWRTLTKPGTSKMPLDLEMELITHFDSIEGFKVNLLKTAQDRFGSGWAWLCKAPDGRLFITSTANQDNPLMKLDGLVNGKPLLGIDVWEHAYYLKYWNKRADYLQAFWSAINWDEVEKNRKEK